MTAGCLLYAFDGDIKYTKFAKECAQRVRKHLDIGVSLVTNADVEDDIYDSVIKVQQQDTFNTRFWHDSGRITVWANSGRNSALAVTPYDRTLLLDVDYLVGNDSLRSVLDNQRPFQCHQQRIYLGETEPKTETFGGRFRVPMSWATVVCFDKDSEFVRDVFHAWRMVEEHYKHYAQLFDFSQHPFRNDFALSIALIIAKGNSLDETHNIPWPLQNVGMDWEVELEENRWWFSKENKKLCVTDQDLHIMSKTVLEQIT